MAVSGIRATSGSSRSRLPSRRPIRRTSEPARADFSVAADLFLLRRPAGSRSGRYRGCETTAACTSTRPLRPAWCMSSIPTG